MSMGALIIALLAASAFAFTAAMSGASPDRVVAIYICIGVMVLAAITLFRG